MKRWRKVNKVPKKSKVFICCGGYSALVKGLQNREWVRNKCMDSPCWDLKWVMHKKDIDFQRLKPNQIINHYNNNSCLTSKRGLCLTLKNLIWHNNIDIDSFFPRCFYLNDKEDYHDFIEEFRSIKAESVLKKFLSYVEEEKAIGPKFIIKIQVALNICMRRIKDIDELIKESLAHFS